MSSQVGPLAVLFLLLGASALPATIVQSSSCATGWSGQPLNQVNLTTNSCSNATNGFASSASSSVTVNTSANVLNISLTAQATAPDGGLSPTFAQFESSASSKYTVTLTLDTAGSGPGYVQVSDFINPTAAGDGYSSVTINGIPGLSSCGGFNGCLVVPTFVPIQLGTPLSITIAAYAYADDADNFGASELNGNIQASFFGPDQLSPISIAQAPEPATVVLSVLGVFGACHHISRSPKSSISASHSSH